MKNAVLATIDQLNAQSPGPHNREWRAINDLMEDGVCDDETDIDEIGAAIISTPVDGKGVSPYKKVVLARIVAASARNFSPGTLGKTFALLNSLRPKLAGKIAENIAATIGTNLEVEAMCVRLWTEKVFCGPPPVLKPRENAPKACWSCVMNRLFEFLRDEEVCAKRWYKLDRLVQQTPSLVLDEGDSVERCIVLDLGMRFESLAGKPVPPLVSDYEIMVLVRLLVDNSNLLARHAFAAMLLLGAIRSQHLKKRVLLAKRFLATSLIHNLVETAEVVQVATGINHLALIETSLRKHFA